MSRANPYTPGLRAVVGHGLPGRPVRDVGGSVFKVGDIHTSAAALPGEWIAADGGPWDERLSDALTPGYKNMVRSPELSPALTATLGRALDMSADARYLAASAGSSLYLYKRSLNEFVRVATVARAAVHCKFSPDGKYLAVASNTLPGSFLYAVVGDALVEVTLAARVDAYRHSCSWSPSGQHLVVTGGSSPPELIKRTGDTFEVCPATFPNGSSLFAAWSRDSNICYVSEATRVAVCLRAGDTFTKQGEYVGSGNVTSMVSSPISDLLLVGYTGGVYLYAYRITGTTLTGLPTPASAKAAPVSGIAFSEDGRAVFLGSDAVSMNTPRVYSVSGEAMTPIAPPHEDTSAPNNHLAMASAGRFLAATCVVAPYLKMFTSPIPALQGAGEGVSRIKVG